MIGDMIFECSKHPNNHVQLRVKSSVNIVGVGFVCAQCHSYIRVRRDTTNRFKRWLIRVWYDL